MTCKGCDLNFLAGSLLGMGWMLLPIGAQATALIDDAEAGLMILLALLCMVGAVVVKALAARTTLTGDGRS